MTDYGTTWQNIEPTPPSEADIAVKYCDPKTCPRCKEIRDEHKRIHATHR